MTRTIRPRKTTATGFLLACFCLLLPAASADVTLPHVFSNNMVLQRDMPVTIWGHAEEGEKITVTFNGEEYAIAADELGEWKLVLPALKAGGPYEMTLCGKNRIHLTNILVGEVWICSGQSNMEWPLHRLNDPEKVIAGADFPRIRLLHIKKKAAGQPASDIDTSWNVCTPDVSPAFSAVAYYFGRELHRKLSVPVGLINTSWGGTRIEPWTPIVGFQSVPRFMKIVREVREADADYRKKFEAALPALEAWLPTARRAIIGGQRIPAMPVMPIHKLKSHRRPTGIYNAMIHPVVPFAIRGAIWYQGEANRGDDMTYFDRMKALINGWREIWGQGDFPFYFVQLAPFRYAGNAIDLAEIWEAQTAALALPNTGMVVTTDIANLTDIHPRNKLDVGRRLALWAMARTYGETGLVYSGPLYRMMSIKEGTVRLLFDHVGGGLVSRDGEPLTWFEVAGENKQFVHASARIDGNAVVVWNEKVPNPVAVRFGWHQEAQPNLANREGLPASPFRTDRW
jgi:sialate O-acetylesterase